MAAANSLPEHGATQTKNLGPLTYDTLSKHTITNSVLPIILYNLEHLVLNKY